MGQGTTTLFVGILQRILKSHPRLNRFTDPIKIGTMFKKDRFLGMVEFNTKDFLEFGEWRSGVEGLFKLTGGSKVGSKKELVKASKVTSGEISLKVFWQRTCSKGKSSQLRG